MDFSLKYVSAFKLNRRCLFRFQSSSSSEICQFGKMQSPVSLPRFGAVKKFFGEISFNYYHSAVAGMSLTNNGYNLQVTTNKDSKNKCMKKIGKFS